VSTRAFYGYKINEVPNKGLYVEETDRNWLLVKDDPLKRFFFSLADIEKDLGITLTLRKTIEISNRIYN